MTADLFGNTVATAEDATGGFRCAWCGTWVPLYQPDPRRRFCYDSCRSKAWEKEHPRVPVQNLGKLTRAEKILERLRQGKATGLELLQAGGGTRDGARVHDPRGQGYRIVTENEGEWPTYRLEE